MNFNLFDNMDGLILRERENDLARRSDMMTNRENICHDGNTSRFPEHTPLAMAYVPFQQWGETYSEDEALRCGTLFPELNFPFERGGASGE